MIKLKQLAYLPLGFALRIVKDTFLYATNHENNCLPVPDLQQLIKSCQRLHEAIQHDSCQSKLLETLKVIQATAESLIPMVKEVSDAAPFYDFSTTQKGNGYRTFLNIQEKYVAVIHEILMKESKNLKSVTEAQRLLAALSKCFEYLLLMKSLSVDGSLYPTTEGIGNEEILDLSQQVDSEIFYGRFIAQQFDGSVKFALKELSKILTSYSEWHYKAPMWRIPSRVGNYLIDDESRGRRHVALSLYGGVDFIKAFWANSDCMLMDIAMEATNPIDVSMEMTFDQSSVCISGVQIKPFCPGSTKVYGRLISKRLRKGMPTAGEDAASPSRGLIVHAHGGGFISQSARSQEIFLRKWAHALDVPIFSLDYPLAPDAAFPRPVHEVFYGYCVALEHAARLGSTGERVVFVGDSAGANLILAAVQECISRKIRVPDGLFLAYVPTLVAFVPSPARLLGLLDPLLPFGVMMRCARAYVSGEKSSGAPPSPARCSCDECKSSKTSQLTYLDNPHLPFPREEFTFTVPSHPYISPVQAEDDVLRQMPPTSLCTSTFDPCLDDTIMMAKRLRAVGNDVSLDIVEGLPHGFLNFCWVSKEAAAATQLCADRIGELLHLDQK